MSHHEHSDVEDEQAPRVEKITINGLEMYVLSVPLEPQLPDTLSSSEREVILLALRGASNAEIAEERGTALQTVANQMRSAFQKLGVNSRGELAARLYGAPPGLDPEG